MEKVRGKIIEAIQKDKHMTASKLAAILGTTKQNANQHLAILLRLGIIRQEPKRYIVEKRYLQSK
jgi:predicted ArsR family transcriptional regulator